MSDSWYDAAWVCANGHTINDSVTKYPQHNKPFCPRCGAAAVRACEQCGRYVQGDYHVPGVIGFSEYSPPAYCYHCGAAFPWTTQALDAARELADEFVSLSPAERESLKGTIG